MPFDNSPPPRPPFQPARFSFEPEPEAQNPFWARSRKHAGPFIDVTPEPQTAPVTEFQPPPPPPAHHPPTQHAIVPVRTGGNAELSDADFSYDVQEIMAKSPHWLLRWGITVVAGIIGVILFLSWLIHYPDLISGAMTLTGANPAVEVVAQESGHLEKLLVKENEVVEKDQILGILESAADPDRVFAVKENMTKLIPFLTDPAKFQPAEIGPETSLGRLQAGYSTFYSHYLAYQSLLADDYAEKTVALLEKQLEQQRLQVTYAEGEAEGAERTLELASERYERMKKLFDRGSLSVAEVQEQEQILLGSRQSHAGVLKELNNEKSTALGLEKQLSDLKHERAETTRKAIAVLQESLKEVLSEIEIWENQQVLRAPIAGTVAFYDFWTDRQYVTKGSQVFVIAPESAALVGRMQVKGNGVGKIEPGQTVNVKFVDYSYKEFGMVIGKVRSISLVARDGNYLVLVDTDFPLVTNFHKEIPFKQSMQANATIVTEDLRLLERIFYQIRRAIASAGQSEGA